MTPFADVMAQVQHLAASERQLAIALGTRAAGDLPAGSKVVLARLVRHAAWRADQWETVSPTIAALQSPPDAPGPHGEAVDAVATDADPCRAARAALAALASDAARLAALGSVGQGAVARVAQRVGADLTADLALLDEAQTRS